MLKVKEDELRSDIFEKVSGGNQLVPYNNRLVHCFKWKILNRMFRTTDWSPTTIDWFPCFCHNSIFVTHIEVWFEALES